MLFTAFEIPTVELQTRAYNEVSGSFRRCKRTLPPRVGTHADIAKMSNTNFLGRAIDTVKKVADNVS